MNIYLQNENDFVHNGLGFLTDVLDSKVTENLNGDYYLIFDYKINGQLSEYLKNENIVKCDVSDGTQQLFIVKNVEKNFDSIKVTCKHIFYSLLDNFIEDVSPKNLSCQQFLKWIFDRTNYSNKFEVFSDITDVKSGRYVRKNPVEIILGSEDNSVINLFNGELKRDNFKVIVNKQIGSDNGVKLIIGKNIKGIKITVDTSSVYTKIMPQGFDGLFLPEKYVDSPLINTYINPKISKVEFSDIKYDLEDENAYHDLDDAYNALRNSVNELFENGIDKPIINVKIDWIELSKTNEYKNYSNLEKVNLGDILTVDLLNFSYKTKVIKTIYNPLNDRIESFELGTPINTIISSTNNIQKQLEKINPTSILETAKNNATQLLTKAMGGFVYKTQNELFIMDTDDPNTATKIWRWNMNGLGYSKNGIDGPYETAITADGQIVADFITTGKLNTNVIEGYDSITTTVTDTKNLVEGQNQKISQITQTVDSINSKISDIADITISGESTFATVTLEHINQSEPIQIKVHPTKEQDISYLYPSNYLYPSDKLFPQGRTIRFKNITTNEIFEYEIPQDLLYFDEDNYDEFILSYDSQTCYINKKVKHTDRNDVNALMLESQTIECEYPKIELTDGDYTVELLGYKNGYIFCQLMAANMYTTQFVMKPELRSEINQTKEEISLEVSKKADQSYVNSKIAQTANEINLAVFKKTDKGSIIATINLSSESATINASKVNINGIVTAINNGTTTTIDGNRISTGSITSTQVASDIITTKNFSAQNINANNIKSGTLSADRINGGTISGSSINLGNGKFVVNTNGILSCSGANFNGSINSSAINGSSISGGSINIDSGTGYYFNMGLSTSHPNCSGLNVGWGGINFNGGKGINNTDGYNFNFSSGCLYAVEKILSVTNTLILQRQNGASITLGQNVGLYGGNIYCDSNVQFGEGGLWINLGRIGRDNNITIISSSSIDLLGGTYGVYASKGGGSTSAVKTDAGSYSSRIVKENIKRFTQKKYDDSLELLDRLELYSYDYKYNLYENKSKYGFIIDELEQNELSKEFFDFYEKEAIVNGKELDFNLTHRKETDKTIKLKNYDSDVLDKYLLTCVKALYNKFKNMEVLTNGK